jgi:long-chain-fatty-acid--CoA ligase ACSBG
VSYLPLSHIAAQIIDVHAPIHLGCALYFAQADALKGSLTLTLKDVKPTFFFGVPRVWEKIQEKMVQMGREKSATLRSISAWAKRIGTEKSRRAQYGNGGGSPCNFWLANALVFKAVKGALGLDCAKCCFTGAAPISHDTLNYFASLDIPIYEVFGQSECTGPHTISHNGEWKIGSCGRPIPGSITKIVEGTKELCYKGRHIFMGYMYMPDKTAETIDADGFLHSGDVAEFDNDGKKEVEEGPSGFMRITGRIKELIITAGGENIPPVLIEEEMKSAMLAISNCMVIGDRRKFLTMLVSLKCEVNPETMEGTDKLAADSLYIGKEIGSNATTLGEVANDPKWTAYIDAGVKKANSKTTSNAQIVQKWKLLPVDFSEKAGDLTPTLKLKRSVVADKYSELIESMYA